MAQTASAQWAPEVRTGKIWQYLNHLRSLVWVQLTHDNILAWRWGLRGSRELEDIEGKAIPSAADCRNGRLIEGFGLV